MSKSGYGAQGVESGFPGGVPYAQGSVQGNGVCEGDCLPIMSLFFEKVDKKASFEGHKGFVTCGRQFIALHSYGSPTL